MVAAAGGGRRNHTASTKKSSTKQLVDDLLEDEQARHFEETCLEAEQAMAAQERAKMGLGHFETGQPEFSDEQLEHVRWYVHMNLEMEQDEMKRQHEHRRAAQARHCTLLRQLSQLTAGGAVPEHLSVRELEDNAVPGALVAGAGHGGNDRFEDAVLDGSLEVEAFRQQLQLREQLEHEQERSSSEEFYNREQQLMLNQTPSIHDHDHARSGLSSTIDSAGVFGAPHRIGGVPDGESAAGQISDSEAAGYKSSSAIHSEISFGESSTASENQRMLAQKEIESSWKQILGADDFGISAEDRRHESIHEQSLSAEELQAAISEFNRTTEAKDGTVEQDESLADRAAAAEEAAAARTAEAEEAAAEILAVVVAVAVAQPEPEPELLEAERGLDPGLHTAAGAVAGPEPERFPTKEEADAAAANAEVVARAAAAAEEERLMTAHATMLKQAEKVMLAEEARLDTAAEHAAADLAARAERQAILELQQEMQQHQAADGGGDGGGRTAEALAEEDVKDVDEDGVELGFHQPVSHQESFFFDGGGIGDDDGGGDDQLDDQLDQHGLGDEDAELDSSSNLAQVQLVDYVADLLEDELLLDVLRSTSGHDLAKLAVKTGAPDLDILDIVRDAAAAIGAGAGAGAGAGLTPEEEEEEEEGEAFGGPAVPEDVSAYLGLIANDLVQELVTPRRNQPNGNGHEASDDGDGDGDGDGSVLRHEALFSAYEAVCEKQHAAQLAGANATMMPYSRYHTTHHRAVFDAMTEVVLSEQQRQLSSKSCEAWEITRFSSTSEAAKIATATVSPVSSPPSSKMVDVESLSKAAIAKIEKHVSWRFGFGGASSVSPEAVIADEFKESERAWLDLSEYELELQAYLADLIVDHLVEDLVVELRQPSTPFK
eukprot:SAG22_NODE_39_length_26283_cov_18.486653_9_plen_888_part_00